MTFLKLQVSKNLSELEEKKDLTDYELNELEYGEAL